MPALVDAAVAWSLASSLAIALLGGACLWGGRGRPRGALAFGLFCIVWAIQIGVGNLARLSGDAGTSRVLLEVFLITFFLTPFFLVEFAASQVPSETRAWRVVRGVAAGVGLISPILLIWAPGLFFGGVVPGPQTYMPIWGPLFSPLNSLQAIALAITLVALFKARKISPTPRSRAHSGYFLAGVSIFAGYQSGRVLVTYASDITDGTVTAATGVYLLAFGTIAAVCLNAAAHTWRALRQARTSDARAVEPVVLASLTVPLMWGIIERLALIETFHAFDSAGLWRLLGVGVIAFGFIRWRHADLPERAAKISMRAGGAAIAGATGVVGFGLGELAMAGSTMPAFAGIMIAGAALVPATRLTERALKRTKLSAALDEDGLYAKRIDTYRAAIETSLSRGTLEEDAAFLASLRDRFGITPEAERVVMIYARASVIIPREGDSASVFERLRLLGEGGTSRAWLARERSSDRLVVLKEPLQAWHVDARLRDMVIAEGRALARLRHPNIVAVEGVIEDKKAPVLVLEYLDGGSLADILRKRGPLPWREASTIMLDVLRGLGAAHAHGILHRDIKPANILFTGDGAPKLADFGIALKTTDGRTAVEIAATPAAGTPAYMAPEAFERQGDARLDIYACGMVLHECIYGARPGEPSLIPDAPAELLAIIRKALQPRPTDRFPDAHSFAAELAKVLRI